MSKEKIKVATDKAAKAIAELVKHFETGGDELSDGEADAVFRYLQHTVNTVREKAMTARDLAKALHGGFDFSAPSLLPDVRTPPTQRERLVREARIKEGLPAPYDGTPPDTDEVDFLDEE